MDCAWLGAGVLAGAGRYLGELANKNRGQNGTWVFGVMGQKETRNLKRNLKRSRDADEEGAEEVRHAPFSVTHHRESLELGPCRH